MTRDMCVCDYSCQLACQVDCQKRCENESQEQYCFLSCQDSCQVSRQGVLEGQQQLVEQQQLAEKWRSELEKAKKTVSLLDDVEILKKRIQELEGKAKAKSLSTKAPRKIILEDE